MNAIAISVQISHTNSLEHAFAKVIVRGPVLARVPVEIKFAEMEKQKEAKIAMTEINQTTTVVQTDVRKIFAETIMFSAELKRVIKAVKMSGRLRQIHVRLRIPTLVIIATGNVSTKLCRVRIAETE
jgi:hypothetical protein